MSRVFGEPTIHRGIWVIVFCALLFLPPLLVYKMKADGNPQKTPNPLSAPLASRSVRPSIEKIVTEKAIGYRLYGRVVQVGKETASGIAVRFVLDADPVQTVLAGFVRPQEKVYELVRYDVNFNKKLAVERISGTELILQALSSTRPLEFGLEFPKNGLSAYDEERMRELDGIIRGNWKSLPSQRLLIQSIGVRARI